MIKNLQHYVITVYKNTAIVKRFLSWASDAAFNASEVPYFATFRSNYMKLSRKLPLIDLCINK